MSTLQELIDELDSGGATNERSREIIALALEKIQELQNRVAALETPQ